VQHSAGSPSEYDVDCRNSPVLAGRWLASIGPKEAAKELLENTDLKQQRQALMQMKPHRAAALLEVLCPRTGIAQFVML